jgi:hypothetical protein
MKIALTGFWLMLSSACVVLPVFVPSNVFSSEPFANVVGIVGRDDVHSFLSGQPLGLPISMLLQSAFALGQYSLMGLYVNTLVFFALGLCHGLGSAHSSSLYG